MEHRRRNRCTKEGKPSERRRRTPHTVVRSGRDCVVGVGGTSDYGFREGSGKEDVKLGRVSAFEPAHGTNAGPVRFGPTRTHVAALVSAPHACSRLGMTCTAARRQNP